MPQKSGLHRICIKENWVSSNYYSDTYRAEFKVGPEQRVWDVIHISLPFPKVKERELMLRFGIGPEQMQEYYRTLGRCVKNCINVTNFLADSEVSSVERFTSFSVEKKDDERGSDIYLVTRPQEPIREYMRLEPGGEVSLLNALSCATRFCQIARSMDALGVHFGLLDMDNVFIVQEGEKALVTMGGFLYAMRDIEPARVKYPAVYPNHVHPLLRNGGAASLATDIYSVCSVVWTMLNGDHYTTEPFFESPPEYASEEVTALLEMGLASGNVEKTQDEMREIVKVMSKKFRSLMKKVQAEYPGYENIMVPIAGQTFDISSAAREAVQVEERKPDRVQQAESVAEAQATSSPDQDFPMSWSERTEEAAEEYVASCGDVPEETPAEEEPMPDDDMLEDGDNDPAEDVTFKDEEVTEDGEPVEPVPSGSGVSSGPGGGETENPPGLKNPVAEMVKFAVIALAGIATAGVFVIYAIS